MFFYLCKTAYIQLSLYTFSLTPGQFYAPEQPNERVLSLSSDQPRNNILVCGDTAGLLHIWDICRFALDIQQEVTMCTDIQCLDIHYTVCLHACLSCFLSTQAARPPLLLSWKAHRGAVVSVDVLEAEERLFILTGSFDGSTGLWTRDGDHVGSFGQEVRWNISEPATYQR